MEPSSIQQLANRLPASHRVRVHKSDLICSPCRDLVLNFHADGSVVWHHEPLQTPGETWVTDWAADYGITMTNFGYYHADRGIQVYFMLDTKQWRQASWTLDADWKP